jgi:hypothetical protein
LSTILSSKGDHEEEKNEVNVELDGYMEQKDQAFKQAQTENSGQDQEAKFLWQLHAPDFFKVFSGAT